MWGATFPSAADLPTMVQADRATRRALTLLIREGQHEGSIRPDADAHPRPVRTGHHCRSGKPRPMIRNCPFRTVHTAHHSALDRMESR